MNSQVFKKVKLPDAPGVYFFLGPKRKILYIGKATSLRDRVRSYFARDLAETRGLLLVKMIGQSRSVDYRLTDSVLEALILEADLIKKFQPPYNTEQKDDKSFNCIVITKEEFPRVLVVRKKDIDFSVPQTVFGPFPNGSQLKDALKIVRRIFPFRDNKCRPNQGKPCFNRQIGLCPGVCAGEISKQEYGRTVRNLKLFFAGKKRQILKNLRREMKAAAERQEFELAGRIKKTVFALEHIQDVALVKAPPTVAVGGAAFRIEAYDIAHNAGGDAVGVMVVVEDGTPKKSDYRKFKIRGGFGNNDLASLSEVIERRLRHKEWAVPALFVADGDERQKRVIEQALENNGLLVPVAAVAKNKRHRPEKILGDPVLVKNHERAILLANNEAHRFAVGFHRKLSRQKLNTRC